MSKLRWISDSPQARVISPLACGLPIFIFTVLTEYVAIAPWGTEMLFNLLLLGLGAALLIAFFLSALALVAVFLPDRRRYAPALFLCAVVCLVALRCGVLTGDLLRMQKCNELALKGRSLVQAIQAYERKYGHLPSSLKALVPEFVVSLPNTGIGACPTFEYLGEGATGPFDSPWGLAVYLPCNLLEFDTFLYVPRQTVAQKAYPETFDRIGDWAYVYAQ